MERGDDLFDGPAPSGGCAAAAGLLLAAVAGLLLAGWWFLSQVQASIGPPPVIPPTLAVFDTNDGTALLGCYSQSEGGLEIRRWDGDEFRTIHQPQDGQVEACQQSIGVQAGELAGNEGNDTSEPTVAGGVYPDTPTPEFGYTHHGRRTAPGGEAVITFCRAEARNPQYYCYLEISRPHADAWTRLPIYGASVVLINPRGVLAGTPSTPNADVVHYFYGYDGTLLVTIEDAHPYSRFHVFDDRIVAVARPDGRSVSVEQHLFSD